MKLFACLYDLYHFFFLFFFTVCSPYTVYMLSGTLWNFVPMYTLVFFIISPARTVLGKAKLWAYLEVLRDIGTHLCHVSIWVGYRYEPANPEPSARVTSGYHSLSSSVSPHTLIYRYPREGRINNWVAQEIVANNYIKEAFVGYYWTPLINFYQ